MKKRKLKRKFVPVLDPKVDDFCELLAQILVRRLTKEQAAGSADVTPPANQPGASEQPSS